MSDVKRYLPSQVPQCSWNAPEYVEASYYDALSADRDRLAKENRILRDALLREGIDKLKRAQRLLDEAATRHEAALAGAPDNGPAVRHVCGAHGFDSYLGDVCTACKPSSESDER